MKNKIKIEKEEKYYLFMNYFFSLYQIKTV